MAGKKALFISGSFGLGHVVRDLAIARELRRENPDIEISWLARHQAGIKMAYSQTTPESLAEAILSNTGKEVTYASIATDGARRAARIIGGLF